MSVRTRCTWGWATACGVARSASMKPTSRPREIPRADVAHALVAALDSPATIRKQFTLLTGPVPVEEALSDLP